MIKLDLTTEKARREIQKSIDFYNRKLNKELGYSKDLQNNEIIAHYVKNIHHLKGMLDDK